MCVGAFLFHTYGPLYAYIMHRFFSETNGSIFWLYITHFIYERKYHSLEWVDLANTTVYINSQIGVVRVIT